MIHVDMGNLCHLHFQLGNSTLVDNLVVVSLQLRSLAADKLCYLDIASTPPDPPRATTSLVGKELDM